MLFSTPLRGPRGRVARIMTRTGSTLLTCSIILFFILFLLPELSVWPILMFAGLFLFGACLLFAPMMLLAVAPSPPTPRLPGESSASSVHEGSSPPD